METIVNELESSKTGEKFHDFVINDAVYYIKKAQEALDEGLEDPKAWYMREQINAKTFFNLLPHIFLTHHRLLSDTSSDENSSHPKSSP